MKECQKRKGLNITTVHYIDILYDFRNFWCTAKVVKTKICQKLRSVQIKFYLIFFNFRFSDFRMSCQADFLFVFFSFWTQEFVNCYFEKNLKVHIDRLFKKNLKNLIYDVMTYIFWNFRSEHEVTSDAYFGKIGHSYEALKFESTLLIR